MRNSKKNIVLFFLTLSSGMAFAQYNEWTWMSGDNIPNQPGVYGTQGVPAPGNKPPARYEGGEWLDQQGNFWIFGGQDVNGNQFNDLWKYDPGTNMWTWVKGSSTTGNPGVYGTIGVPNIANTPGARDHGSATCVDALGNFWLFGGQGLTGQLHNDLWKYDPVSNMWTWISGTQLTNQAGIYGTIGVPSVTNCPGGRCETDAMWVDASGFIWLFGGRGIDASSTAGFLNDLWKFNPATNEWTWVKGANAVAQSGVYGTQGVPAPANVPGSRMVYAAWKDLNGNFWIHGGWIGTILTVPFNDLWKYDPSTNMWTWMDGNIGFGQDAGSYGTMCVDYSTNRPRALGENRARWSDDCGNLWVWGGCDGADYFNHLWRYSHASGNWTWVNGVNTPNQVGVYGTQGVSAPTNMPGARRGSFAFRRPGVNELWFFGGGPVAVYNDLWRYVPDKPVASFSTTTPSGCQPPTVSFTNNSTPGCNEIKSYAWNFGDTASGPADTSSLANPSHTYSSNGSYTVWLVVINCTGSRDSTSQIINVSSSAPVASITSSANVMCNGGNNGSATVTVTGGAPPYTYYWSPTGGTSAIATGLSAGMYTVLVTDSGGCTAVDSILITEPPPITINISAVQVSCMTSNAVANVTGGTPGYSYLWSNGNTTQTVTGLAPGTYIVTITDANDCTQMDSVVISANLPVAVLSQNNILCNGQCTGVAMSNVSGGTAPYSYLWSNTATTQNLYNLCAGTYTLTVTDSAGCVDTQTVSITEPPPLIVDTLTMRASCGSANGAATALPSGGTPGYTYTWSTGHIIQTDTGLTAGIYTVTVTDANGCTQIQVLTVSQTPPVIITVNSVPASCGSANGTATAFPSGGTPGFTYTWSNGQTTQTATGLGAGTYTVTVTDTIGCSQMQTIAVGTTGGPTATVTASITHITVGQTSTLTATGGGTYLWSTGQTTSLITVSPTTDSVYCVMVADTNLCSDTACVKIFVEESTLPCPTNKDLTVPNAFSPNKDGQNDVFCLQGWNVCVKNFIVHIYDRWGEEVFKSDDPQFCWDGTYKGKALDAAVFVYYIDAELTTSEEIVRKGNISLLR